MASSDRAERRPRIPVRPLPPDGNHAAVAHADTVPPVYLIWSHEHRQWWGPGRCGYVQSIAKAGRYTHAEALDICAAAVPGDSRRLGALPELPVREADVLEIRNRFRAEFPSGPREYWE